MKVREIKAKLPQEKTDESSSKKLTPEQENRQKLALKLAIAFSFVLTAIQVYFLWDQPVIFTLFTMSFNFVFLLIFLYIAISSMIGVPLEFSAARPTTSSASLDKTDPYYDPGDLLSSLNPDNPNYLFNR